MQWSGYYYKILDSWTPPIYSAPRWFVANSYPTLTDDIAEPGITSFGPPCSSITSFGTGLITALSPLSSSLIPTNGSTIQRLFEAFTNEKEYLYSLLLSTAFSKSFYFDEAEPQFAWIFDSPIIINNLEIKDLLGNNIQILPANNDLELFYSGGWRWRQDGSTVLVYGLDIQEQLTESRVDQWQFISCYNQWSSGSLTYIEHPITKNWFPIHPSGVRSDGFLNYYSANNFKFRSHSPTKAKLYNSVSLIADSKPVVARRVNLTNSLDEKGLWIGIPRRDGESNEDYGSSLLDASWFSGQNKAAIRNFISASLRQGSRFTISASSTGFNLPTNSTGYSIRNINQYAYISESWVPPDPSGDNTYRSIFSTPDMGCAFVDNVETLFSSASGIIVMDTYMDNGVDFPSINWRLQYWTDTPSSVTLTNNFPPNVPDLVIFCPQYVQVTDPSTDTLKKSFNRTSPTFSWSSYRAQGIIDPVQGLALFDF